MFKLIPPPIPVNTSATPSPLFVFSPEPKARSRSVLTKSGYKTTQNQSVKLETLNQKEKSQTHLFYRLLFTVFMFQQAREHHIIYIGTVTIVCLFPHNCCD